MWLKEYSTLDISYSPLFTPLYMYHRGLYLSSPPRYLKWETFFRYIPQRTFFTWECGFKCTLPTLHTQERHLICIPYCTLRKWGCGLKLVYAKEPLSLHCATRIAHVERRLQVCHASHVAHVGRWLYARVRETILGGGNVKHRWEDRVKLRRRIEHERGCAFFDIYPRRFSYSN